MPVLSVSCFATLPFANLLAANIGEPVDLGRVVLYWLAAAVLALLPIGIARPGRSSGQRLGVLVSAFLFLFFSFPAARALLGSRIPDHAHPAGWALGTAVVLGVALLAASRPTVQTYIALVGVGLLLLPAGSLIRAGMAPRVPSDPSAADDAPSGTPDGVTPSIYFFVPDGYAALDVVEGMGGTDIPAFQTALEDRGFRLSERAKANYPTTVTSLSSTLDMTYLVEGGAHPDGPALRRRLEGRNLVVDRLRHLGYRYIHAYPGFWKGSRCHGEEDLCLGDAVGWSETDIAVLGLTPLSVLLVSDEGPRETLRQTSDPGWIIDRARPWLEHDRIFLFAHLLAPHPPFIRDDDCTLREDVEVQLARWPEDPAAYAGSIACLNHQLLGAVDRIVESDPDALIVIQADHGPSFGVRWDSLDAWLETGGAEQRLSILSAIRLPSACRDRIQIPETLTPVNTFRIVFACLEGRPPALLPDRSFFIPYEDRPAAELGRDGGPSSQLPDQ